MAMFALQGQAMTQQLSFPEPTTAGDLAPNTRIKHDGKLHTITGYILPRSGNYSVLLRSEGGAELVLTDETVVEVAS